MLEAAVIIICFAGFITLFILDMRKGAFFYRYFSPLFLFPIIPLLKLSGLPEKGFILGNLLVGGIAFLVSFVIGVLYVSIFNSGRKKGKSSGGRKEANIFSRLYIGIIVIGLSVNILGGILIYNFKTCTHTEKCEAVITLVTSKKVQRYHSAWEEEKTYHFEVEGFEDPSEFTLSEDEQKMYAEKLGKGIEEGDTFECTKGTGGLGLEFAYINMFM